MDYLLSHYQNVCVKEEVPYYHITKFKPVHFSKTDTTQTLWEKHADALKNPKISEQKPDQSLLDLKIELATRMLSQCSFCEHQCMVDRTQTKGYCRVTTSKIASEFIHYGEEPLFVPSHTIFFSGCTFQCVFCQNWDISQFQSGLYIPPEELARRITIRQQQGAKNVNWVGGEPTPNIPYILKTLKELDAHLPQIWNSNMYCSREAMSLLDGIIDVYLIDYKFGRDSCAENLAHIPRYSEIIHRNLIIANKQADVLVRHLILPNHITCCSLPILYWLHDHLPNILLNIMGQYQPCYKAKDHPLIHRAITPQEYKTVQDTAKKLQLNVLS